MTFLNSIISQFSNSYQVISHREDFELFEAACILNSIKVPDETLLQKCFEVFGENDLGTIYINIDESDDDISYFKESDFLEFAAALEVRIRGIESDTIISLKVRVEKVVIQNELNLYSVKDFEYFLNEFSTSDLLDFFAEKLGIYKQLIFTSEEIQGFAKSQSLVFKNKSVIQTTRFGDEIDRAARLKNIQLTTHAVFLSDKLILPEDFYFAQGLPTGLKEIFDRLNFALVIISIFDITHLTNDDLSFRINGYKGIDGTINLMLIPLNDSIEGYREIYNWIHESGNLNDKLGLARNIISLHLNATNDLSFTGNMLSSILSAYKVYEKQNIKQYIEIRNKLSDQLIDYNKRANTIIEGFAGTFQKSALSVLTLFSSIIALKVLGNTASSANFIFYSTVFSLIIVGLSVVYMFISRSEAKEQKVRYENSYFSFKERYTDLLNSEDITRILNNDKEFKADIAYISKKIKSYTILWVLVLGMVVLFIAIYFINEKMDQLSDFLKNFPRV